MPLLFGAGSGARIGLVPKILFTAFVAVLVPSYLQSYGPTNFLYFCDIALLLTLIALWTESPLLASMPAVGILVPQTLWCVDFAASCFGFRLVGMTDYMFNSDISLFARGLSLFHGWLPFVLVWLVFKLGYDRRALIWQTLLAWLVLCVCYFLMPAPPAPAGNPNLPVNINYVFGMSDSAPQTWMPANAWFALMLVAVPVLCFLLPHFLLSKFMPVAGANGTEKK